MQQCYVCGQTRSVESIHKGKLLKFLNILREIFKKNNAQKTITPVDIETKPDLPWPEHKIKFDSDAIKARGYISIKRDTLDGIKGYRLTKPDGTSHFMLVEIMLLQKMAKKKK